MSQRNNDSGFLALDNNDIQRFWSKVNKTKTCWLWQSRNADAEGYGTFSAKGSTFQAHKIAFVLSYGLPLPGLVIMHMCDNPRCVNPSHLKAGTQSQNVTDSRPWRRK